MANRVLIIVTRYTGTEFSNYWNVDKKPVILGPDDMPTFSETKAFEIQNDMAIIVNGEDLEDDNVMFGKRLKYLLTNTPKLIERLENSTIGLISHKGAENPDISPISSELSFNEKYSSTLGKDFCDSYNSTFVANDEGDTKRAGVLDAFRDALIFDKSDEEKSDAFDNLWKYFDKDSNLNIKLKILHQCLIQKDAQQIVWPDELEDEKKARSNFEYLKRINSTDLFDSNYLNSLTNLRDSLLSQ